MLVGMFTYLARRNFQQTVGVRVTHCADLPVVPANSTFALRMHAEVDNEEGGTIRPYKCMGKYAVEMYGIMHNVRSEIKYAVDLYEVSTERTGV